HTAVTAPSFGAALCSHSLARLPRVPTPIQPMLTLLFAPRADMRAGPVANAAVFRKLRRLTSADMDGTSCLDCEFHDIRVSPAPGRGVRLLSRAAASDIRSYWGWIGADESALGPGAWWECGPPLRGHRGRFLVAKRYGSPVVRPLGRWNCAPWPAWRN